MANELMEQVWNGPAATGWIERRAEYDAMLAPYDRLVTRLAAFNETDRILDVGCGTGSLSRLAAAACPHGSVVGVDISEPLLQEARRLSASIENLRFLRADAQTAVLPPAEVVISRFGVMFFDDPSAAFANIHLSTEPGGRLVFVCWRGAEENGWVDVPLAAISEVMGTPARQVLPAAGSPGPFAFADRNHLAFILTEAGWADVLIEPDDREILIGGGLDLDHATDFVLGDILVQLALAGATAEQQGAARAAVRDALAPYAGPAGVALGAAAWVVAGSCLND